MLAGTLGSAVPVPNPQVGDLVSGIPIVGGLFSGMGDLGTRSLSVRAEEAENAEDSLISGILGGLSGIFGGRGHGDDRPVGSLVRLADRLLGGILSPHGLHGSLLQRAEENINAEDLSILGGGVGGLLSGALGKKGLVSDLVDVLLAPHGLLRGILKRAEQDKE